MKKANQVLDLPDQRTNYNAVQLSLPMDIAITLDQEDEVFSFLEAVKGVNFSKYVKPVRSKNTRSHSRTMLLKTMLFGYMNGVQSLEELSQLCRTDLRYLYLTQEERPGKMAFSRMTETLAETIDEIFFEISGLIAEELGCDTNVHYIDGTKIEANANKNTFVYKKRILNGWDRLTFTITESICQYLMEMMVHENIEITYGKGHHKNGFQVWYDRFLQYAMKLEEYEYWLEIIGARNSCSKTDHDATMMATKWDYCNQS